MFSSFFSCTKISEIIAIGLRKWSACPVYRLQIVTCLGSIKVYFLLNQAKSRPWLTVNPVTLLAKTYLSVKFVPSVYSNSCVFML